MRGKFRLPEERVTGGYQPKMKWRSDKIADTIHVQHDIVVPLKHFTSDDRVSRIDVVVQESRPGSCSYVEQRSDNDEKRDPNHGARGTSVPNFFRGPQCSPVGHGAVIDQGEP